MNPLIKAARYRSRDSAHRLIALSLSYERAPLLARGFGLEHLRELLVLLARPLLRQGASLAYGGRLQERNDNFTFDLLRLVSAEQDEAAEREKSGDADDVLPIGRLFNYSAWPHYLRITPALEARWINSCRIIRIDQAMAGIAPDQCIPDGDFDPDRDVAHAPRRVPLNSAICLSAMRRMAMDGLALTSPDVARTESVPPVSVRIVLGGRMSGFSGFLPGIFEEVLLTLERGIPLYLLGGFGGAAEVVARALLAPPGTPLPETLHAGWQFKNAPALEALRRMQGMQPLPYGALDTETGLARLGTAIENARGRLPQALATGLDDIETRELMETRDMRLAAALVHKGLEKKGFVMLAA
ncbi:MAG: hypothetical protein JSR40_18440 [Proteobacteria bacterium]|nr:hypothetical protein [Pseudomonadota bacterium]